MSKFFTLILIISFSFSFAQNWQTVSSNRVVNFSFDSVRKTYFETVAIDSLALQNGDSILFNFTSFYGQNCDSFIDTSWIGSYIRIDTLGNNYFHSKYGDTFLIKTQADSGEIWDFSNAITATVVNKTYGLY